MENHRFFLRHYLLFPHEVESSYQRLNGLRSDNFKKPGEFFFEFVLCILRKNISSLDPLKKGTTAVVIPELPSYTMRPSIVHSSTWNGLNYPEYITELNLVETGGARVTLFNYRFNAAYLTHLSP